MRCIKMRATVEIKTYLDHITQDLEEVKKMLIPLEPTNRRKTEEAWKKYERGEFKSMDSKDFLKALEKW